MRLLTRADQPRIQTAAGRHRSGDGSIGIESSATTCADGRSAGTATVFRAERKRFYDGLRLAGLPPWRDNQPMRTHLLCFPLLAAIVFFSVLLSGCAVAGAAVSVAGTAVSVGAGAVGLAADAAIGTARITGKAVGAAADAVLPGDN